ncbi:hypothetical protein DPMN_130392 [Dreissena polymorpha]|uniref:Uncharacterized protein n=1 Tax=Dreissena polymorpha TaxID=45954 RepID=A0A9D4H4L4_DREPO|nr:hypothetical protein DPMN_130392 [Dreissena polymorpha]
MIGKAIFTEMDDTNPILAKIFFVLYIITVVFFVLTIFLSILGGSIDNAVGDMKNDTNEDLMEYLMRRFASLIRLQGNSIKGKDSLKVVKRPRVYKTYKMEDIAEATNIQELTQNSTAILEPRPQTFKPVLPIIAE